MSLDNILLIPGLDWTPRNLFRPGDNGLWQDMSNFGTLRQLSTGSTLVSSVGDPIGYIADSGPRGHLTTQTTNGKRPILSRTPEGGVVNLASWTEDLTNASWLKVNCTATNSDTLTSAATFTPRIEQTPSIPDNVDVTLEIEVKPVTANSAVMVINSKNGTGRSVTFDLVTGEIVLEFNATGTITAIDDGWFRLTITGNTDSGATALALRHLSSWGNSTVIRARRMVTRITPGNYQKSTTRYDITEAGKRDCWAYGTDGIDDAMSTPSSVDMSGSDEMTVCVGVRKFSDAATGIVGELSAIASNPGTFVSSAPSSVGANSYRFSSTGTSSASAGTGVFAAAPDSAVILGESKISTDVCKISRNGTLVESVSDDQGTGNYGDYRIYFDARAETSLFFQGLVYQRVIINRLLSDYEKTKLQQFVARKMGITL